MKSGTDGAEEMDSAEGLGVEDGPEANVGAER